MIVSVVATKLIVLFATGVFLASLAYSLGPGGGAAPPDEHEARPRREPALEPRLLGPRARELRAAPGIWSAWKPFPPLAGEPTTVLWRTEGTVARVSVAGRRRSEQVAVRFGPTPVLPTLAGAGLAWKRPGREWGSRLLFPSAGVWTVRVRAGARTGAVRVRVVEGRPASG
jgi:hypothetical protein